MLSERQRRRVRLFTLEGLIEISHASRILIFRFLSGLSAAGILAFRWLSAMEMIICRAARPLLQQQQRKTGIKQFNSWAARAWRHWSIPRERASDRSPLYTTAERARCSSSKFRLSPSTGGEIITVIAISLATADLAQIAPSMFFALDGDRRWNAKGSLFRYGAVSNVKTPASWI